MLRPRVALKNGDVGVTVAHGQLLAAVIQKSAYVDITCHVTTVRGRSL